jgi:hypothetical protein
MCNKICGVLEMIKDRSIDICCVTETWFKSKENARFAEIHDFGYDVISAPRRGIGGGVAFVFNPKTVNPTRNNVKGFKSFEVVECVMKTTDNLVRLCVVYRSTQTKNKLKYEETKLVTFFDEFEEYLDSVMNKSGAPMICGDFNFHVEDKNNAYANRFISLCESKGFVQNVHSPTHVSGGTLDLVLTLDSVTTTVNDNCDSNLSSSGYSPCCVADSLHIGDLTVDPNTGTASDHFLVKFDLPITTKTDKNNPKEKQFREFNKIDVEKFREDIFCSPINMGEYETVDQATRLFTDVVECLLDKHAPVVTKTFKPGKSPWWDLNCQQAKCEMRRAQRKLNKDKTNTEARVLYKEKCVDKAIIVDRARNMYYDKKFSLVEGDPKGTYNVINHLLDKEFGVNKLPNGTSDKEVAENLKSFFDDKVKTIYKKIESESGINPIKLLPDAVPNKKGPQLTSFRETSEEELEDIIRQLPNKSSTLDAIPLWLFKECLPELMPIVHFIVNESLRTGTFPSTLKTAAVRPSLKKPTLDADELKNYRPISNLTYLSKLLEKVVHRRLIEYLDNEDMFSSFQSGYRKFHSCETAITKISNDLLIMMDKKTNAVLLLLDLSAAFDTINHDLLISKLIKMYGISDVALSWLKSYLSDRTFKVVVNGVSSNYCELSIGVPQGSILGPLLFIMYTRDLEKVITMYGFSVHLYADDTQVYFVFDVHSENPDLSAVKKCFIDIKIWMTKNFLKLNDDKTEFMDIGYYVSPIKSLDLGEFSFEPVTKAKNLGFVFDHQLNMNDQINAVSQACYLNQRNLRRIGSRLSHDLKVQLVHSNILSIIDYCNAVYGGLTEKYMQKLQKIQNNAVRFIFNINGKKKKEHIMPYLKLLHFLPIRYRIKFKAALLVFKTLNNLAPTYLCDMVEVRDIRRRSVRLDEDYYILKTPRPPNFTRTYAAFSYFGPKTWNELPYKIRCITDLKCFKTELKTYYFNIAFEI